MKVDLSISKNFENMIETVLSKFGKINIQVNNAGIGISMPLLEITDKERDQVLNTNLSPVFFFCRAIKKQMIKIGKDKIINNASTAMVSTSLKHASVVSHKWLELSEGAKPRYLE